MAKIMAHVETWQGQALPLLYTKHIDGRSRNIVVAGLAPAMLTTSSDQE